MWRRLGRFARFLPLLGLLALPFILLRMPSVRGALDSLVGLMRETRVAGLALFLAVEAVLMTLTAPIWLMSGLAGYAYGFGKGLAIAWPGVTLGACAAFLVGRVSVGKLLSSRAGEGQFWRAVDRSVRSEGLKITMLMRITFALPQNLMHHMLSATPLSLRDFAAGSFLGLLPATVFHVYLGSSVESAAQLISGGGSSRGPLAWVTLVGGLVLTVGALVVTSRIARRALDKTLVETQKGA
jgi:uncharacterized membrane protein YdjX (TVP38/TMEM64 family)